MTSTSRTSLRLSAIQRSHRGGFVSRLLALAGVMRSRRDLRGLTASQLDDIGVSRTEAEREARRAPWDVPNHWLSDK